MRFFVTAAQEAAMRVDIARDLRIGYEGYLQDAIARATSELVRVRADRREELARLADPHAPFIAHLEAEVTLWRLLYTAERQKNDVATDRRLAEHGLGGITGPTQPLGPPAELPGTLDELLRATELGAMGRAEGVER